jgi:hypothetical protein
VSPFFYAPSDLGDILGTRLGLRWDCVAGLGTAETVTQKISPHSPREAPQCRRWNNVARDSSSSFFGLAEGNLKKALKTTQTLVAKAARVRLDENLWLDATSICS